MCVSSLRVLAVQLVRSSGATGWTGGDSSPPPFLTETNFLIRPNPMRKRGGGRRGGTVGFINVSRSNKYTCRVMENCAFKLLYDLENSLHYYPENPGNCISGIPDFKIFTGEHALGPP